MTIQLHCILVNYVSKYMQQMNKTDNKLDTFNLHMMCEVVYTSSKCSGKTLQMHRLARAIDDCI